MITESNSGSHKVAVMTKAASEQADAIAKEHRAKPIPDNPIFLSHMDDLNR